MMREELDKLKKRAEIRTSKYEKQLKKDEGEGLAKMC